MDYFILDKLGETASPEQSVFQLTYLKLKICSATEK